jgi:two-component system, sensor histidine kinase LadS
MILWFRCLLCCLLISMIKVNANHVPYWVMEQPPQITPEEVIANLPHSDTYHYGTFNGGNNKNTFWLIIPSDSIKNNLTGLFLIIEGTMLDYVDVYSYQNSKIQLLGLSGDRRPLQIRPIRLPHTLIHLKQTQPDYLLIRLATHDGLHETARIHILTEEAIPKWLIQTMFWPGLLVTVLVVLTLFSFILFSFSRKPVHGHFSAYTLSYGLWLFQYYGLGDYFLFPNAPWGTLWIQLTALLFLTFMFYFSIAYLDIRTKHPKYAKFIISMNTASIITCTIMLISDQYLRYFMVLMPLSGFLILFILGIAVKGAFKGDKKSRSYIITWSLFIIGGILYAGKALGVIPANFITEGVFQIGLVIQALSLAIGMAFSIYDEQKENNLRLEVQVSERTSELYMINEKLNESNRQLAILSVTDPLTGLPNRRKFSELYTIAQNQAQRFAMPSTLLIMDVDYFKNFNDHYGHVEGDACLQSIANQLQNSLPREADFCCRFGGEEFLVYLTGVGKEGCETVAHRLLQAVMNLQIPHCKSPHGFVTISIGCSVISPKNTDQSLQKNIEHADKALYQAKNEGRNRACIYNILL